MFANILRLCVPVNTLSLCVFVVGANVYVENLTALESSLGKCSFLNHALRAEVSVRG